MDEREQSQIVSRWLQRTIGPKVPSLVLMTQPHGRAIVEVSSSAEGSGDPDFLVAPEVDGAEASGPRTPVLVVKSADCVPILAVDPEVGRCAGLHAGWRGVAVGILPALLERWRKRGSSLRQVRLAFGPHIRQCCFEVRQDCTSKFQPDDMADALEGRVNSQYLSLDTVLRTQAARFGIGTPQIEALPLCTDCGRDAAGQPQFASYRRSNRQGQPVGRNLSYIALLPHGADRA